MPTLTIQGHDIEYSEPYIYENITFPNDEGELMSFAIPDVPWDYTWFMHPTFLKSCQDNGFKMETMGDLKKFFEEAEKPHATFVNGRTNWREYTRHCLESMTDHMYSSVSSWEPEYPDDPLIKRVTVNPVRQNRESMTFMLIPDGLLTTETRTIHNYVSPGSRGGTVHCLSKVTSSWGDAQLEDYYLRVQNWSWNPSEQKFLATKRDSGKTCLFLGIELEISTRLSVQEIQAIVACVEPKQEPFFYIKDDSSINGMYDNKMELVTHPMTPRRAKLEWRKFFGKLAMLTAEKGHEIGDYFDVSLETNNGLHIHLSKDAFDGVRAGRMGHLKRFLASWNMWDRSAQQFYQAIGKRAVLPSDSNYYHIHPELDGRTLARRLKAGVRTSSRSDNGRRHSICHETAHTLELRIFQGHFDIRHVLACIEVTMASFEYTRECPLSKYNAQFIQSFKDWTMKQQGYKYAKEAMTCA